jgi:hypothetical protein
MASVAPARRLAAAGLALVLTVGWGIALAPHAVADTPSCAVTSKTRSNALICAPTAPPTAAVGGAPSEQDLTSANGGRHH